MAIEFGTDGWRATLDEFTVDRVHMVGQAVADYLSEFESAAGAGPVLVGYDARETSRGFAEELCRVLCANGYDALVPERDVPTPVVAWTILERDLPGALMVTASHNPPEYNGVKFIPDDGAPALPEVTERLEANLRPPDPDPRPEVNAAEAPAPATGSDADTATGERSGWGRVREDDLLGPYLEHVVSFVDLDLSGLTVACDAMHGSGRGVTDIALERAGASVERLRHERDPEFGGTAPEPTGERLQDLTERVTDGEAVLGIANDGDADRIGVVTPGRGYLNPNLFFAAMYEYLLSDRDADEPGDADGPGEADEPGDVGEPGDAVRTVSTTYLVDRVAAAHDSDVAETAVGFKWVAQAMAERNALVGGEESGGFGLRGHVRNKDGVLFALLAAAAERERPLDDRVDALLEAFGEIHQDRVSLDCPDDRKGAVVAALEDAIPDRIAGIPVEDVVTVDGFKVLLEDGSWLLVRPSGTEPKIRVYAESSSADRVDVLLADGRDIVEPLIG